MPRSPRAASCRVRHTFHPSNFLSLLIVLFLPLGVMSQPGFNKTFSPDQIGPGNVTTLTYTITNASGSPVEELAFSEVLTNLTIASPASLSNSCDGAVVALEGSGTISLTGGRLGGNSTCSITINVTGNVAGTHSNTSGDLTSTAGNSGTSTDDITVDGTKPSLTMSFSPDEIPPGGVSTLSLLVDNTAGPQVFNPSLSLTLPLGLEFAPLTNLASDCATFIPSIGGNNTLNVFGTLPASSACNITVDVTSPGVGSHVVNSDNLLINSTSYGYATAVLDAPLQVLSKSFINDPVAPGDEVQLEFTIRNLNRSGTATNFSFTDDLDAALSGLTATVLPANGFCGAGSSLTGSGLLTMTGGSLAAGASCTFTVTLQVPGGAVAGKYLNTTSALSFDLDGTPTVANTASDNLLINVAPKLSKTFAEASAGPGDQITLQFEIENTGTLPMTDISFSDIFESVNFNAVTLPADGFCGSGSNVTYTPLFNPPAPSSSVPPRIDVAGASLAGGASCSFDVVLEVALDAPDALVTNVTSEIVATVDGETVTGPGATDQIVIATGPTLTKEFDNEQVAPGGTVNLTFSISLNDDALGDATDISFTDDLASFLPGVIVDPLPSSPCNPGSSLSLLANELTFAGGVLSPGDPPCTFSISLQIPAGATPGSYTNTTSEITSEIAGFPLKNAPGTADVQITPFTLSREFTNDPVFAGDAVDLTFTLTNFTTDPVTDISFSDNLSQTLAGLVKNATPISNSCASGTEVGNASTLFFTGFSLPGGIGQSCSFTISLDVPSGAVSGSYPGASSSVSGTWNATAVVASPADDILEIIDAEDILTLTKSFSGSAAPGDIIDLDFVLSYVGGSTPTATNISFSDDLDAVLTGLTALAVINNTCTVSPVMPSNVINFSGQTLNSGNACSFTVQIQVPINAEPGDYTNTTSTVTATGITGNEATDVLTIIEVDHELPQADAGPDQDMVQCNGVNGTSVTLDGSASSSIHPPIQSYTWTENGVEIATGVTPTVLLSPGEHTILLTVVDALDAAVDEVIITIVDTQNPVLTCPDGTGTSLTLAADDQCQALLPDYVTEASVSDNCESGLAIIQSPVPGTLLAGDGTTQLVTLSATDAYGNMGSCSFTVEVEDQTDPVITCGGDILQNTDPGICEAVVTFADPIASDNCGIASVICNPPSGSAFPVGTTTVTCTATDVNGNTAVCTFDVIIADNVDPVITCPDDIVVGNDLGFCSAVVLFAANASDNCPGVLVSYDSPSGSSFPVGTSSVLSTATDASGNMATCSFLVTVIDNEEPDISLIGDNPLTVFRFSGPYVDPGANISDNCDLNPTLVVTENVNTNVLGTYIVDYLVSDVAGNEGNTQRIVHVIDDPNTVEHAFLFLADHDINGGRVQRLDGAIHANNAISLSNGLGSNQGGPTVYDSDITAGFQISVGRNNIVNGDITSPSVSLGNNTVVNGLVSEAAVSAESLPTLSFSAGGTNTTVPAGGTLALTPGSYGSLTVGNAATLALSSGDYYFTSILINQDAILSIDVGTGPVSVNSTTQIIFQEDITMGMIPGGDEESEYLKIQSLTDIFIQDGSKVLGQLIAPQGQINIGDDVAFRGSVCADYINMGSSDILHHDAQEPASALIIVPPPTALKIADIRVQPNPFVDRFSVFGSMGDESEGGVLRILDIANREVFTREIETESFELEVDLSSWMPGMYFVVMSSDEDVQTIRIIKTQ